MATRRRKPKMRGVEVPLAATYGVELLFDDVVAVDEGLLLSALRARFPEIRELPGAQLQYVHAAPPAEAGLGAVPPGFVVIPSSEPPDADALAGALKQTRAWPEARQVVSGVRSALHVADVVASAARPDRRLALFHASLGALLEQLQPVALHWTPAQRIVEPATYAEAVAAGAFDAFAHVTVNVRSFRTGPTTTLMDTMGLTPLGLPELQCHFDHDGVDANRMALKLYRHAFDLFERGDIIQDGDTIAGLSADEAWACGRTTSLAPPSRAVIDIAPGPRRA